jgi:hypothetical protein
MVVRSVRIRIWGYHHVSAWLHEVLRGVIAIVILSIAHTKVALHQRIEIHHLSLDLLVILQKLCKVKL